MLFCYLPLCGQLDNGSQRYVRVVIDNRGIQLSAVQSELPHNGHTVSFSEQRSVRSSRDMGRNTYELLALVVQMLDRAIHQINCYILDKLIRETNGIIHWIVICPVDSAIHLLNNLGLPIKEKF